MVETVYEAEVRSATSGWWLLLLVGALSIAAGIVILFKPSDSLSTLAVIAGIFLLLDGLLEIVAALWRSTPNRGMVALFGAITAIIGVLLIRHPVSGVAAVALLVGLWLIVAGLIRTIVAVEEVEHRAWHAFAGVLELIAGIVIVASPDIGFATLAILVGIGFILNGIGIAAIGWGMRQVERAA